MTEFPSKIHISSRIQSLFTTLSMASTHNTPTSTVPAAPIKPRLTRSRRVFNLRQLDKCRRQLFAQESTLPTRCLSAPCQSNQAETVLVGASPNKINDERNFVSGGPHGCVSEKRQDNVSDWSVEGEEPFEGETTERLSLSTSGEAVNKLLWRRDLSPLPPLDIALANLFSY